jgi:hypothetical protein|tara:strand:+ start:218 stop:721 length:504 start_codon:yes stop_codon:yes gene_type:complete
MASILNVDQIKNAAGTSALTIDSSGRISTPARPAFKATLSSDSAQTTSSGWVTVPWNTASINVGGSFNTGNHTFTTPVAGIYLFSYIVRIDNATGGYLISNLLFDGTTTNNDAYFISPDDPVGYLSLSATALFNLAAGVAVTNGVYIYNDSSWTIKTLGSFNGYLLG